MPMAPVGAARIHRTCRCDAGVRIAPKSMMGGVRLHVPAEQDVNAGAAVRATGRSA